MPKINQSIETSVMDERGELVSKRANRVLSWGDEPSYIKLYLQDIMYLADIPKQYAALTFALLKRVSYAGDEEGMCVVLAPRIKQVICKELGWKRVSSFDNALQKLLAGKILYRLDRGIYQFNPYLFGKGDWQDISNLRLNIQYDDIKGRSFSINVDYAEKEKKRLAEEREFVERNRAESHIQDGEQLNFTEQLEGQMSVEDYLAS